MAGMDVSLVDPVSGAWCGPQPSWGSPPAGLDWSTGARELLAACGGHPVACAVAAAARGPWEALLTAAQLDAVRSALRRAGEERDAHTRTLLAAPLGAVPADGCFLAAMHVLREELEAVPVAPALRDLARYDSLFDCGRPWNSRASLASGVGWREYMEQRASQALLCCAGDMASLELAGAHLLLLAVGVVVAARQDVWTAASALQSVVQAVVAKEQRLRERREARSLSHRPSDQPPPAVRRRLEAVVEDEGVGDGGVEDAATEVASSTAADAFTGVEEGEIVEDLDGMLDLDHVELLARGARKLQAAFRDALRVPCPPHAFASQIVGSVVGDPRSLWPRRLHDVVALDAVVSIHERAAAQLRRSEELRDRMEAQSRVGALRRVEAEPAPATTTPAPAPRGGVEPTAPLRITFVSRWTTAESDGDAVDDGGGDDEEDGSGPTQGPLVPTFTFRAVYTRDGVEGTEHLDFLSSDSEDSEQGGAHDAGEDGFLGPEDSESDLEPV